MTQYPEISAANDFSLSDSFPPDALLFGQTETMKRVKYKAEKLAATDIPVLILGESGSGKGLLAKYVHRNSPCAQGPFVHVNCATIPSSLFESELFGHEEGSFTGAIRSKPGWVEIARHGTLFLDEITELPLQLQTKLLQLLQDGCFCRIGGQQYQQAEVRFICASNRRPKEEVAAGRFRADLLYRINVAALVLAPLRERRRDIPAIARYFLELYNAKFGRSAPDLPRTALEALADRHWPGNIRELENVIKNYVMLDSGDVKLRDPIVRHNGAAPGIRRAVTPISLKRTTREAILDMERRVILEALQEHNWNRKKAARSLDISYRSLFYKMRSAGLGRKRAGDSGGPAGGGELVN